MAFLLLEVAAEEDKTQRKQAEHEGVFSWFGDDLAVDSDLYGSVRVVRKIDTIRRSTVGSYKEVADGFVQNARTCPSRSIPSGIGQSASGDANPHLVKRGIILHKKMGNSSAAAADGDGGRVSGAGRKSDVGFAAAGNSRIHRSDVFGIGTGKQRRKRDVLIVGPVGLENVSAIGIGKPPRVVSRTQSITAYGGSDVTADVCRGGTAKNPDGLVVVVLAGININVQLRVRPPPPPQMQATAANKDSFCFFIGI